MTDTTETMPDVIWIMPITGEDTIAFISSDAHDEEFDTEYVKKSLMDDLVEAAQKHLDAEFEGPVDDDSTCGASYCDVCPTKTLKGENTHRKYREVIL